MGKGKVGERGNHVKVSPSFTWQGFIGINPDSFSGIVRAGSFIVVSMNMENFA